MKQDSPTIKNYKNPANEKRRQIMQSRGINRSQFYYAYLQYPSGRWGQLRKLSRFKNPKS